MAKTMRLALALTFAVLAAPALAQVQRIAFQPPFPAEKTPTATVLYCRTYFEERWAARSMAASLPVPVYHFLKGARSPSRDASSRLQSGTFEQRLGDFDVAAYVASRLPELLAGARGVDLRFPADEADSERRASHATPDKAGDHAFFQSLAADGSQLFLVLKLSYGMGQKRSGEQFGFRKAYRPYLRVYGKLMTIDSRKVLWQDEVIVFGDKAYKSGNADADQISREELVSSFESITTKLGELLRRRLDGEVIKDAERFPQPIGEDERF